MAKKKLNYLGSLQAELDAIVESGEFIDYGRKLGKNDTILGELPVEVKAIRTLLFRKSDEIDQIVDEFEVDPNKGAEQFNVPGRKYGKLKREAGVLDNLVWVILEENYPNVDSLAIVEGFKVVKPGKSEAEEALEDLLESFANSGLNLSKLIGIIFK
ncbi:MAG: hypothetical protein LBO09_02670 [Candidatus Peribacteria bacterium]|jgi:hypothetical protein|nr:hypothetical protein [Candidatus Peribacteria bacterium]